jgi:hypothetical protein
LGWRIQKGCGERVLLYTYIVVTKSVYGLYTFIHEASGEENPQSTIDVWGKFPKYNDVKSSATESCGMKTYLALLVFSIGGN